MSYCASIANGGDRLQLHLVDKVTDYTRQNVVEEKGKTVLNEVGVSDENLEIVREGMAKVTEAGGTAAVLPNLWRKDRCKNRYGSDRNRELG